MCVRSEDVRLTYTRGDTREGILEKAKVLFWKTKKELARQMGIAYTEAVTETEACSEMQWSINRGIANNKAGLMAGVSRCSVFS